MADKPKHASEYKSEQVDLVRAMCLYVATKLGDMMDDLLIIGGLVPSSAFSVDVQLPGSVLWSNVPKCRWARSPPSKIRLLRRTHRRTAGAPHAPARQGK